MFLPYFETVVQKYHLDDFSDIIDMFEDCLEAEIKLQKIKDEQSYINILVHTAGNVIVTTREILCLSAFGYADGAMSLARTLYEHFIIISFLNMHEKDCDFQNYIDDYYLDYDNTCQKYFKFQADKLHYDELLQKTEAKKADIKSKAHRKVDGDYWWTGYRSFRKLADAVFESHKNTREEKLYIKMHAMYKRACQSIHPNCFSNTWRLESELKYNGINTAPSKKGHVLPLQLTSLCLIYLLCMISEKLNIDCTYFNQKLNKLATLYVKFENEG